VFGLLILKLLAVIINISGY